MHPAQGRGVTTPGPGTDLHAGNLGPAAPTSHSVRHPHPPNLWCPPRMRKKKFDQAEEVRAEHAKVTQVYKQQGWTIVYPEGSLEDHPVVGRVGGYGVYFVDNRDTATYIPLDEEQTNIRGELRASLQALEGTKPDAHMLVSLNCLLIVNGRLGWAQKWRRHGWAKGQSNRGTCGNHCCSSLCSSLHH